jgi:hypothetical protein
MSMEPLGGSLPPGRPVAVSANGRTHVFAIGHDARMHQWVSNGIGWSGPILLPGGNLPASYPCAVARGDGTIHVVAIGAGGSIWHWRGDGTTWSAPAEDRQWALPASSNGLAATSWGGARLDVFGIEARGILHTGLDEAGGALPPGVFLPGSGSGLSRCVPAAVSWPQRIDVFVVDATGIPVRWSWQGGWSGPVPLPGGLVAIGAVAGVCALAHEPGHVELFGIDTSGQLRCWTITGSTSSTAWPGTGLTPSVPAVVQVGARTDVFAIGADGGLLRWQRTAAGITGPLRLDGSMAVGGVGAAVRGGHVDVFGIHGGGASLEHWPGGVIGCPTDGWKNWCGNQQVPAPAGHCRPTSVEELVAIVKQATAAGRQVRAVGSSWSFSEVAVTRDYIVETSRLDRVLATVPSVLSDTAARRYVHVEAGIQIKALMQHLDANGLAPLTMGGSNGQTFAGALSTCVHGTDFDRGPLPDTVRAIHLVAPDGSQHWIEPAQGITDRVRLQDALGPEVQVRYDDDWFDAVLVSVGTLGIIYSVIIEVAPQYDLVQVTRKLPWTELRPLLESGQDFEANRAVLVAIDPQQLAGTHTCYLLTRTESNPTAAPGGSDPLASGISIYQKTPIIEALLTAVPGALALLQGILQPFLLALGPLGLAVDAALKVASVTTATLPLLVGALKLAGDGAVGDFLATVLSSHPDAVTAITSLLTSVQVQEGERRGWAHTVMSGSNDIEALARGPGLEIAFDCNDGSHLRFVDELLQTLHTLRAQGHALGGWLSLRFVGHSRALLSPQQSSRTCMVEVVGLRQMTSTDVIQTAMEALAERHDGVGHWGMAKSLLAKPHVARAYPNLDTWRRVRFELTAQGTIHTFDNDFARTAGLTDAPATARATTPTMSRLVPVLDAGVSAELFGLGSDGRVWQRRPVIRRTFGVRTLEPQVSTLAATGRFAAVAGASRLTHLEVAHNADGRLELFALDAKGGLWHCWQQGARGGPWGTWARIWGANLRDLAVATNALGCIEVFGPGRGDFDPGPRFYRVAQVAPNGGWDRLLPLGNATGARRAVVGANQDGRLEVFAIDRNPGLWHVWQGSLGGNWQTWSPVWAAGAAGDLKDLAVTNHADGRLVVLGLGKDGRVHQVAQTGPNAGWGGWSTIGDAAGLHQLTVARHADGRLEIWGLDGGDGIWHVAQTAPDRGWGSWTPWWGLRAKRIAVTPGPGGRLEIVAVDRSWAIHHAVQAEAGGSFGPWSVIG